MQTGTLSGNACSAYGAPATIVGTTSQTVASGNCYLLTLTGTDNVGNTHEHLHHRQGRHHRPERTDRVRLLGFTNSYYPGAGSTVYFKGGSAGGFTATASGATDADTGISGYNYGAVAGTGWANAAGAYTFTAASPTGTGAVTASNNAGLTGAARASPRSPTPPPRAAAPSPPTASQPPAAARTSYLNAGTTLTINSRTDYTDGGSGLASSTLTMQTGTLSGNSCSGYGAPATIVGTTSQTVASGNCYLLTLTGTDNVGNTASITHHGEGGHHRPERAHRLHLLGADQRATTPARLDRLLQGRRRRRLHRHRLGRGRRRPGIASYNYGAIAGSRLGQRRRRLHLHRHLAHRHRHGHRHQQRRTTGRRPASPPRSTRPPRPEGR